MKTVVITGANNGIGFETAGHIYYILPAQIHSRVKGDHAEGWFLAVDLALIAIELQAVFENQLNLQLPC